MLRLFDKEGKMVEESKVMLHGKSSAGLIFQTALLMLLSQIAALLIVVFFSGFTNTDLLGLDGGVNDAIQLTALFMTTMTVIAFLLASRKYYGRSFRSLGLIRHHALRQYLLGLVIGFVMIIGAAGIALATGALEYKGLQDVSLIVIGAYLLAFIIQGFSEELVMRGFFMNAYAARKGMFAAIIVNSVVFAMLHLGNDGVSVLAMINLILAGIVFSLMAAYFDNIIVCSAAHSMWNFAQGNLFGVLVSGIYLPSTVMRFQNVPGMDWLSGGAFGLEGGIAVTVIEILSILLLCYVHAKKEKHSTIK